MAFWDLILVKIDMRPPGTLKTQIFTYVEFGWVRGLNRPQYCYLCLCTVSMGVLDHLRVLWVSFIVVIMKILAFGHLPPTHLRPLSKYGFWQSDILSKFTLVGHEDGSQTSWHPAGGFLHALDTQKACFWVGWGAFIVDYDHPNDRSSRENMS